MAFFNLSFLVHGTPQLAKLRGVLQGIGQQSYKTFDALARSMSTLDKATGRTLSRLAMFAGGGGLAYGAIKTVNYSLYQSNSMITTNRIMLEELVGTAKAAKGYIKVVQDLSGSFGTDMSEMMNASRGLIQMFTQIGSRGNQPATPQHLDKMLKLVTAVSLLDTENRGLAYTAFAFKEGLQGVGQGDWRSMKNRLEVNLGKPMEKAITAAVKAGKMDDVVRLFEEAFKGIGINADSMIKRIMSEGLTQNFTRFMTYVSRSFQMVGENSYLALAKPFARLNTFIAKQFDMGDDKGKKPALLMRLLGDTGESLNQQFITPFRIAMDKFTESFKIHMEKMVIGIKILIGGVFDLFTGLATPFIAFAKGLFGITTSLDKGDDILRGFGETAEQIGKKLSKIGLFFRELADSANGFALAINSVVKAFIKLSSALPPALVGAMFGGIRGGLIGAGAGAVAGSMVSGHSEPDMVMVDGKMVPNPNKGGMGIGEIFSTALMGLFGISAVKSLFGGGNGRTSLGGGISGSEGIAGKVGIDRSGGSILDQLNEKEKLAYKKDYINSRDIIKTDIHAIKDSLMTETDKDVLKGLREDLKLRNNELYKLNSDYSTRMANSQLGTKSEYWLTGQQKSRYSTSQADVTRIFEQSKAARLAQEASWTMTGGKLEQGVKFMNSPVTGAGLNTLFIGSFFSKFIFGLSKAASGLEVVAAPLALLGAQFLAIVAIAGTMIYGLSRLQNAFNNAADAAEAEEKIRMAKYEQDKLAKTKNMNDKILGGVGLGTYRMAWNRDPITSMVNNPEKLLGSMLYEQKYDSKAGAQAYIERMDRLYNYKMAHPEISNEEGVAVGGNAWASVATHKLDGSVAPKPSEILAGLTINVKGAEKDLSKKILEHFEEMVLKMHPEWKKSKTMTKAEAVELSVLYGNAMKTNEVTGLYAPTTTSP